ncbi:cytochrome P450 family protein [Ceratobasidium sp. AG-Ba]|nr:cytochrome P450 family protein [Ceratobasidium sp. AG-Ba]QRW03312.1 cytochrome P450 family protein [Ceratobasidium sp. AG-Ba]
MDDNRLVLGAIIGAGLASAGAYSWYRSRRSSVPLPPGPKGTIILGNLLDLRNASAYWLKFTEYNEQYGPLVSVRILHRRIYLVSDPNLVSELFEKRAANYSDRNINEMGKLIGREDDIIFLNYGPLLKRFRTMLQRALNNRVSLDYTPLQQSEVVRFMRRLVDTPEGFMEHIHLMAASIAIRITYGHKVESANDPFVRSAEEIMEAFSDVSSPGKWMVNMFPILKYVPSWFPLATFKRRVEEIRHLEALSKGEPFEFVLRQMVVDVEHANGTAEDSFTSKLLQTEDDRPADEETKDIVKNIAGSLYAAGSDTTVAGKGSDGAFELYAPAFDRRRSFEDDTTRGQTQSAIYQRTFSGGKVYRIPARSSVMANIWMMLHDPETYPEPDRFNPERYLVNNPPPEPESYVFGFGRRICPGLHIAQQSMWITISNTLFNFNITKAKDENGQEITPEGRYTTGIIV